MIVWHGSMFSIQGMRRIVPSLEWLPFGFAYLALPVGYGLMILVLLEQLIETLFLMPTEREEKT
jgi:TRAP-type C4-dicarboxylate transport system permease small subunit